MGVTPNTLVTRTLNLNAEGKVTPGVEKERLVIVDVPKKDDENTPKDGNHSEKLKNRKEKIVDNIPEDEDRKNKQNTPFEEFSDKTKPLADLDHEIVVDKRSSNDDENTPKDGNHSEKLKNRKEKIVDNIPEDVDRKNKQNTPFEEFSDSTKPLADLNHEIVVDKRNSKITTKPLADLDHEIVVDKRSSNVEKGTLTEEVLNGKIAKSEKTNEVIPDSIAEESGVTPSVDNPTVTVLTVNTDEPITEGAVEPTVGVTEANGGASGVGANGVGASGGVAVPTLAVNEDDTKLTHKTTSIPRNPITRVAVQDCPCDITKGVCDINCCCDNDCSARDRLVFSHCLPLPILSSSQYCFSKQLIYIKNSPHYIVTQPDNSLLCIETENLRSKTNFTHFRPITTLKNFAKVFDRRKRPTWSQAVLRTSSPYSLDRLPHNQSYKVGQPIWILNATSVGVFGKFKERYTPNHDAEKLRQGVRPSKTPYLESGRAANVKSILPGSVAAQSELQSRSADLDFERDQCWCFW
ncbi:uncharacterized protein LOC113468222 [Diaphorina citri]|uniref:Uncharacterized protein LOC113468222 n=1 Tax=Diaphorina citri TaxID=121845 RepID=A0A3Q0J1G2_DIACI|nr:uncharacterized protein LOC113468222 [Diaphorina citri]